MAKQGMARPERTHTHSKNDIAPVPEIQGNAKSGNKDAFPINKGTSGPWQKALHAEWPISEAYKGLDNDLARDNMENDLPVADLQDL